VIDFGAWRRQYDDLTYSEQVEFYRAVAEAYPEQIHFNEPAIRTFLDGATGKVLEIGGWKGELAQRVLPDLPEITEWLNVEIAPQAVTESVCLDPRYLVTIPETFIWDSDLDIESFPTVVASHVIEHMKIREVRNLLSRIRADRLYVDAPLPPQPSLWGDGQHSHIIEVGWDGLGSLIESHGFRKVGELEGKWGPAYWFRR